MAFVRKGADTGATEIPKAENSKLRMFTVMNNQEWKSGTAHSLWDSGAGSPRIGLWGKIGRLRSPFSRDENRRRQKTVLGFDYVGTGLMMMEGALRGFAIPGADLNFVPADAEIRGISLVVSSPEAVVPTAVP